MLITVIRLSLKRYDLSTEGQFRRRITEFMDSPSSGRTILVIQSELVNETRSLNLVECARFIIQGCSFGRALPFVGQDFRICYPLTNMISNFDPEMLCHWRPYTNCVYQIFGILDTLPLFSIRLQPAVCNPNKPTAVLREAWATLPESSSWPHWPDHAT